jgi:hypothetical protein
LTLSTDPQQAVDSINTHNHTGGLGGQIPTDGIQDGAITGPKLAQQAVAATNIVDQSISAQKLTADLINLINSGGSGGAGAPGYFRRDIPFAQSLNTKILTPNRLWVNIGTTGYALETQQTFDATQSAAWDTKAATWQASKAYALNDCVIPPTPNGYIYRCTTAGTSSTLTPTFPTTLGQTYNDGNVVWICQLDYTVAANRKGKDFYIYACQPASGIVPVIILSDNSTIPLRYSTLTSRKVGGFHCLCANVGTISGHTLTGYNAGDILPASVWDLNNRPVSAPEGMVYDANTDRWVDIYLASVQSGKLGSVYNAPTADGASTPTAFHWYNGTDWLARVKKDLLTQREFVSASMGSNQGTNIAGSADVNTTGGHNDTAGRRMISNIGCEDMCGFLWQWGSEAGGPYSAASWANAFDGNDTGVGGQHYNAPDRALLGGSWGNGAYCGSRASYWTAGPRFLYSNCGLRGCAEPLRGA